jgi:ketosteroid isomerase-like protein
MPRFDMGCSIALTNTGILDLVTSENLELVRSTFTAWERGDFRSDEWAHPDIEYVQADGPEPGTWVGLTALTEGYQEFVRAWEEFLTEADEYRQLDNERVLVLFHRTGRGKASGLELVQHGAHVYHVCDGRVKQLITYWDRDRALADLGLEK